MRVVIKQHVDTLAAYFITCSQSQGHHAHTIGICDIANSLHFWKDLWDADANFCLKTNFKNGVKDFTSRTRSRTKTRINITVTAQSKARYYCISSIHVWLKATHSYHGAVECAWWAKSIGKWVRVYRHTIAWCSCDWRRSVVVSVQWQQGNVRVFGRLASGCQRYSGRWLQQRVVSYQLTKERRCLHTRDCTSI